MAQQILNKVFISPNCKKPTQFIHCGKQPLQLFVLSVNSSFFFNYGLYFCHLSIDHELIQKFLTKGPVCKINPLSCKAFASFGSEIEKGNDNHQKKDSRVEYGFSLSDR